MNTTEKNGWLQTNAPEDDVGRSSSEETFSDQNLDSIMFLAIAVVTLILLFVVFNREFYLRKHGVDIFGLGYRSRRQTRLESDRAFAEELQRRLNEEEREAERSSKRDERRLWYESYIKAFTMIAESKDLFFARDVSGVRNDDDDETPNDHASPTEQEESPMRKRLSSNFSEISDEEIDDIESSCVTRNVCLPVACDEKDEDAQLYLRLPVNDEQGNRRIVDGQCAICFSDYEPDDKVVWSGLQCQHAFHADCLLPWLAKGKKRCPTCRHWFVPGTRIEDQKQELEERLRAEAEGRAASSETSDVTTQEDSQQIHAENSSSTAVQLGTPEDDDDQPVHVSLPLDVDVEGGIVSTIVPLNDTR